MKYRTEWKYICNEFDLDLLKEKMKVLLSLDQNANKEVYNIHSLYFDDYNNTCAFDNDAGSSERFKWRIRYYDDNSDYIKLERKEKYDDLCYKESCLLSKEEYQDIIDKNISKVFWKTDKKLLKEFCIDIMCRLFSPKIIIDYERTAYTEPISNIRITFDKNISGSLDTDRFITNDYMKYPVQEKGIHVLEVKFDDVLPGHVGKLLHTGNLQRNTFSKYYLGRLVLERNLL
ncbi:MAG: polyphosphate polymerase domain-containing protein [Erysipelotrichaceae bacterium]|nr:polyphosphate polymerase domain-containing protein [Erysipelotrichaceae bacterium]